VRGAPRASWTSAHPRDERSESSGRAGIRTTPRHARFAARVWSTSNPGSGSVKRADGSRSLHGYAGIRTKSIRRALRAGSRNSRLARVPLFPQVFAASGGRRPPEQEKVGSGRAGIRTTPENLRSAQNLGLLRIPGPVRSSLRSSLHGRAGIRTRKPFICTGCGGFEGSAAVPVRKRFAKN